jgi:hypothetical protein
LVWRVNAYVWAYAGTKTCEKRKINARTEERRRTLEGIKLSGLRVASAAI